LTTAAHSRTTARTGPAPWVRWRASSAASVRSAARALRGRVTNLRSAVLQTGALSAGTASAWTINLTCGLAALCVSLFVLELLTDQPAPPAGDR
jgi:hypothetical protein